MKYGLFDTVDQLWIGDDSGPRSFSPEDPGPNGVPLGEHAHTIARCAAEAACYTVGWDATRIQVRELPEQPWHEVDEVTKTRTALEWLKKKERGTIL